VKTGGPGNRLNPKRRRPEASAIVSPGRARWILVYNERGINENGVNDVTWLRHNAPNPATAVGVAPPTETKGRHGLNIK
jgi:hypothetical protein